MYRNCTQLYYRGDSNGWIGLNRLNTDGHEWTDGTGVDFTNWDQGEPNDGYGQESCTSIYTSNGYWNDEQCGAQHGFICKKPSEGSWTTEKTTHYPSGHCPPDWMEFEGRCYQLYYKEEDKKNWSSASFACKNNSISR